ncbi:hypothetical protein [Ruania alba]|uniref:Uncharacterized protein n=1 Tax=Ruania alba TaxID=648782 RepID=A0A1H5GK48_9MICO|nr:hypothetical protein [Ruania alba]SEE15801.1 hypothetical protein SAMN04488554_1672 [Ruania alba]
MSRTGVRASVALLGAVLLAACGSMPELPGGPDPTGAEGSDQGSSDGSGNGGTIPPQLLECGDESADPGADDKNSGDGEEDDESLVLTETDLTTVRWSTPSGYAEASGYHEDNPVEELHSLWVAEPVDDPAPSLNVLNVAIYVGLDWGQQARQCGQVPLSAVEERLAGYMEQIDAELLGEPEMTEVAGLPAISQRVRLSNYDYVGYWLFSQTDLVHLYCQWTDGQYQELIEQGCAELVPTVEVG